MQNSLKYMLGFGAVTRYLGYSSLNDFFPAMDIKPNPGCANALCGRRQEEEAARAAAAPPSPRAEEAQEEGPVHDDNEWSIEVVPDLPLPAAAAPPGGGIGGSQQRQRQQQALPEGLHYSHVDDGGVDNATLVREAVQVGGEEDVDALLAQLSALGGQ